MMQSSPNLPSSSPILTFILIVVMGLVMMTMGRWFLSMETPVEAKQPLEPLAQKMVGKWEKVEPDHVFDLDLDEEGNARYALRASERLNLHGTWKLEEGRLVLHVEQINGGSMFRVGDNVTLGQVLNVEGKYMTLGNSESQSTFRKRKSI